MTRSTAPRGCKLVLPCALCSLLAVSIHVPGASGVASLSGGDPARGAPPAEIVRGMTISCRGDGVEWASDDMVRSMAELKGLGVNWIAIHPYAGIRQDGQVYLWRRLNLDEPPAWLTRPIAEAHRLGLKIMIKPHIGYWGSGFSWRGAIDFETEEQWRRFFDDYRRWITRLAEICKEADAFVVGTELDRTIQHVEQWRRIIREVRSRYSGPLTYAANWSDYQRVAFWDALDVIGVQAYFPIITERPAEIPRVTDAGEIAAGWQRILREVVGFSGKLGKRVVFTELGYNRSFLAPYEPWNHEVSGPDAEPVQASCLEAALRAVESESTIAGVFLWKWFPGDRPARDFAAAAPAMRKIISECWLERSGEQPPRSGEQVK